MDIAAALQRAWASRGPMARLLRPIGAVVASVAERRRHRAPQASPDRGLRAPVIVVGNLVAGGAGKTPVTLALIDALRGHGWHPGVVSRGYGRRDDAVREVGPADDAALAGDEPLLIRRRAGVPVVVGRDRAAAARHLLDRHPAVDLVIADDGLQHHALPRDAQVVVFDERGVGNGWCLPAGPLREPMPPRPWPRTVVVYNADRPTTRWPGACLERRLVRAVPLAAWWTRVDGSPPDGAQPLATWHGRRVVAVAGTARPERFFEALEAAGLDVERRPLPDHHPFDALPWAPGTPDVLLTEKDAVKLDPARRRDLDTATRLWVVPLEVHLPPETVDGVRALLTGRNAP
jgi:tetraacyldisaccharide 4'-kinase